MGLVLLFYHTVLAKEKSYQINRWYLLFGLVFSLTVPFLPIGVADSYLNLNNGPELSIVSEYIISANTQISTGDPETNPANRDKQSTSGIAWMSPLLLLLYGAVFLFLFIRMIWHLGRMQLRSMKNPAVFFKGHKVVLLDEEITPHTFWSTIFVNRQQYEDGHISNEILIHELTHARQQHSLDILFVEFLKTIFWFNPILYFYKTTIQLNHEFLADDNVLSQGTDVTDYQTLLLNMQTAKSANALSTSLHFKITKKRFQMMTQHNSPYRSLFKTAAIIPLFLILGILFGCQPTNMEKDNLGQAQNIMVELVNSETIKLNGEKISPANFESRFAKVVADPKNSILDFKVHQDIPVGLVSDIQEIFREHGTLRINYSQEQPDDTSVKQSQGTTLEKRNILRIAFKEGNNIMVNQQSATLSSVKKLVKEFITNNGQNDHLSESPRDAIIAIETLKNTFHDTYINALDKIMAAYDELRNEASLQAYGKPFQLLKEESKERNQIENRYSKRISIKEPS
jgi:beta-lactamase regulating signal transducer with metallopeptidase domain/biopolymer transport protein ExbD